MYASVRRAEKWAATIAAVAAALAAANSPCRAQDTTSVPTRISLGDAARIAAHNSASSQGARIRVGEARARVTQTRSALFPNLTATGAEFRRTLNSASFGISFPTLPGQPPLFNPNGQVIPPFSNIDLRGRLAQPIFDFGAFARIRQARAAVVASSADATVASEQAGSQAALAYVRAIRAEDDVRARAQDSVLAADLVNIAQAQLQAGTGVALDVTRAQSQLAATRAELIASRGARDRARIDLARALNLPARTPLTLADSLGAMDTTGVITDERLATERALRNRPDLLAAEARIAAAQQSVSAIRAERLPSVSLVGDDGVNGLSYRHLLNTYEYGVQLSVPVFDGFQRASRIQEQQGVVREAEVQQRDIEQQAAADVSGAIIDVETAQQQVAATRDRLRLAEQEVAQARERFSAGVAGNADVITALLSLTTARTSLIDAETNYQNARVALSRAQGAVTTLP